MNDKSRPENLVLERRAGLILASLVVFALIYFVANPPQEASTTLPIVRFLAALCGGLSAFLFLGSLHVETHLPFSRGIIKGSGAFATFIAIFFLFLYGIPTSNNATSLSGTPIEIGVETQDVRIDTELANIVYKPHLS